MTRSFDPGGIMPNLLQEPSLIRPRPRLARVAGPLPGRVQDIH